MLMIKINGLACGLVLAAAGLAGAQQAVQETRTTTTTPAGTTTEVRRVSQIIGSDVRLQGGNSYGKVEDVILNDSGGIDYVVVARDGRYALFPWNAADVNYGKRVVTYDVAPQAVQPLFFARDQWPNISDQRFTTRMREVFPNARAVRREALRPAAGVLPPGAPAGGEKVKVKEQGGGVKVKVKEKR
jgi:sporulation protein YlmC with PRC-barrel domain